MNLNPRSVEYEVTQPDFLITGNHLQYTAGNITLDSSKLKEGQVIKAGTAVFENDSTGLYELVASGTPATMKGAVLTVHAVRIDSTTTDEQTAGLVRGSVWEDKLTGVTDNFKEAVKNRITFDL